MSNKDVKHSKNVAGKFYCTSPDDSTGEGCIACGVCYNGAADFFTDDESGSAFVKKQPANASDEALCQEQMDACPVSAIGNDG